MKFQKPLDVWKMNPEEFAKLQPGNWIFAGEPSNKGRFLGVKKSGSVVVAWIGNERNQGSYAKRLDYVRTLRQYAKAF